MHMSRGNVSPVDVGADRLDPVLLEMGLDEDDEDDEHEQRADVLGGGS